MARRIFSHRGVRAATALVLVLLLLAAWHYWTIVSSLSDARAHLLDIEEHLSDIGLDLMSEDLARTQAPLTAAERDLGRARTHLEQSRQPPEREEKPRHERDSECTADRPAAHGATANVRLRENAWHTPSIA